MRIDRSVDYDRRWVREQRQQFLKQKVWTLHVRVERSVKCRRVPLADWLQFGDPRIDKEDPDLIWGWPSSTLEFRRQECLLFDFGLEARRSTAEVWDHDRCWFATQPLLGT